MRADSHNAEMKINSKPSVLDSSPDLILFLQKDGTIFYSSNASKRILGRTPDEMIGKTLTELSYLPMNDEICSVLNKIEQNKHYTFYSAMEGTTGQPAAVEITVNLSENEDGEFIYASLRDITGRSQQYSELHHRYSILEDELSKRKMIEENLIHQSDLRKIIIEHTHFGISALDKNMIFIEWNPAMEKMTGLKSTDMIGRSWKEIYAEHVNTEIYYLLMKVFAGNKIELRNRPLISKKGFHNSTLVPLYNDRKEVSGILTLTEDITDEKYLHDKLRENESFLKKITETSPNTITVTDIVNKKILFANRAFLKLNELEQHHLTALDLDNLFSLLVYHEDIPIMKDHLSQIANAEDDEAIEHEYRVNSRSGPHRWFHTRSVVFKRDENGKVLQILTNGKEITNRKKAEEELLRNRDLLIQAQQLARLGVWEYDHINEKVFPTEEFNQMFGFNFRPGGVSLEAILNLVHPEDVLAVRSAIYESINVKEPFTVEFRVVEQGGRNRFLLVNGKPKLSADGKLLQYFGSGLDITELRDTEALLKKKEEFLSIASHELKTPLTTAKAYIELVSKMISSTNDISLKNYVQRTSVHIDKLTRLISDLLDISKIQSGKMQFEFKEFDLDEMLKDCIENLQATATKHQITFEGRSKTVIKGDKERLGQVISNLVSNAIKYSPNANDVQVKVRRQENVVLVSVKDHGIGIPKESFDKLFDRFFRVDIKRGHFQGLGIGLFITKEIIQRHGGSIRVESEPDKGSEFTFMLPIE